MDKLDTMRPFGLVGMAFVGIMYLPMIAFGCWCIAKRGGTVRIWPIVTFEIPTGAEPVVPADTKPKKHQRK